MASLLELNTLDGRKAQARAHTGVNGTVPVPSIAAMLYLDHMRGRQSAAGLLVGNRYGQLMMATSYISVIDGPLSKIGFAQAMRAIRKGTVTSFTIEVRHTTDVALIVRGRRFMVTIMSLAELRQWGFGACTTDATGCPIL